MNYASLVAISTCGTPISTCYKILTDVQESNGRHLFRLFWARSSNFYFGIEPCRYQSLVTTHSGLWCLASKSDQLILVVRLIFVASCWIVCELSIPKTLILIVLMHITMFKEFRNPLPKPAFLIVPKWIMNYERPKEKTHMCFILTRTQDPQSNLRALINLVSEISCFFYSRSGKFHNS